MRVTVLICFLAAALLCKLWANTETRRGLLPHKPRREPGSRTNHFGKGDAMRTQSTQQSLEAERVWGVEALDPLQQRAWAENIWQELQNKISNQKPGKHDRANSIALLVLQFGSTSEPAAIRALNTLARIARTEAPHVTVWLVGPDTDPLLPPPPVGCESLFLIHRVTRFVNWKEWRQHARALPQCRAIVTVSQAESTPLLESVPDAPLNLPEVTPEDCEQRGLEVLAKSFGDELPGATSLSRWEKILVESGIAEVALPVSLLARHLALDAEKLSDMMQASRLKDFLYWSGYEAKSPAQVAFRGAWPARKIAPAIVAGEYPALFALLADANPHLQEERTFILALLMALRAQGCAASAIFLQKRYAGLFAQARRFGRDCPERQAWACFDHRACCADPTTPAKV